MMLSRHSRSRFVLVSLLFFCFLTLMAQIISHDEHILELQESLEGTAEGVDHLDQPDAVARVDPRLEKLEEDLDASKARVIGLEGELAKAMANADMVNEPHPYH
jgi:hypothetical protein